MTQTQILILVASLCALMLLAVVLLFPLLRRYGVKTDQLLTALHAGTGGAAALSHAIRGMVPDNKAVGVLDQILQSAQIGVAKAEQLYKVGTLTGGERKQTALDFVYGSLALAGVTATDEVMAVVDGCVEAAVHSMDHKSPRQPVPLPKTSCSE